MNKIKENIYVLIFTLISVINSGYYYPKHDQRWYIPHLIRELDNSYFTKDYLLQLNPNRYTFFFKFVKLFCIGNPDNIPIVFFIFSLTFIFFYFFTVKLLSKKLFNSKYTWIFISIIIIFPISIPNTSLLTIYSFFFTRQIVYPLILLSVYYTISEKYIQSILIIIISSIIHITLSLQGLLFILFFIMYKKMNVRQFKLLMISFCLLIFSLITFLIYYNQRLIDPLVIKQIKYYKEVHPYPNNTYNIFKIFAYPSMIISYFIIIIEKKRQKQLKEIDLNLYYFYLLAISITILGILVKRIAPTSVFTLFRFDRYIFLNYIITIFYLGLSVDFMFSKKKYYSIILFLPFIFSRTYPQIYIGLPFLIFFILYIDKKFKNLKKLNYVLYPLLLILLIIKFSIVKNTTCLIIQPDTTEINMFYKWIKNNTDKSDIFLIPPIKTYQNFRIVTHRTPVFTFYDYSACGIKNSIFSEWYNRSIDLNNWEEKSDNEIENLSKKYKADYVVTQNFRHLDFPVIYRTDNYCLFKTKLK